MLSVNTWLFLKDHIYIYFRKGCTQWTRHWWCFIATTKDCELLQPISYGLCEPACHLPWQDSCCVVHPCPCWWLLWAQLKLSTHLAFPRKCFCTLLKWNCLWVVPIVQGSSLAVELGSLGCLPRVLCPERVSLIPLPRAIHHRVRASPRLFPPVEHNQKKETSREGRNSSVCPGVILSKVLFWGCVTPGEDQPHTCCEETGVAQPQAVAQTGQVSPAACAFPGCQWPLPGWGNVIH